jgi:hypothetical protein
MEANVSALIHEQTKKTLSEAKEAFTKFRKHSRRQRLAHGNDTNMNKQRWRPMLAH